MPSVKLLRAENEQRKRDAITHISSDEAMQRTGYGSDGTKVSQKRREEEKIMYETGGKNRGMLASICMVM
jgi:hypothetical protein